MTRFTGEPQEQKESREYAEGSYLPFFNTVADISAGSEQLASFSGQ